MNVRVGIYEAPDRNPPVKSIGWKLLCEQEKTPFIVTNQPDCLVMVFDGITPDWFAQYMSDGGIGIVTDCHPDLLPIDVDHIGDASIEWVDLTDLGSSFTRVQCLTRVYRGVGYGKILIHENRVIKNRITQDEFPVFLFERYGNGGCFYTGLPIAKLVTAIGDTLRETTCFSNFSERIVSIDKHHLMKAMREILIMAFHKREVPYFHLGYFPGDYQSALTFRIDIDGIFGENLINISKCALENDFNLTFFANKSLCKDEEDYLQRIDPEHEIGNHGDVHNLFTDYDSNLRNVQDCRAWLKSLGIDDNKIFSAPRGMWNYSLHKALNDLGYIYTSDFGMGIGGFPYFPYINGARSGTLQIPVDPFSAERASVWMLETEKKEITAEFVAEFYLKIIEENYSQGYPINLYSHPEKFGPMAGYVFQQINNKIEQLNLWKTTLTQFAYWWISRDKTEYCIEYSSATHQSTITGDIDTRISVKAI